MTDDALNRILERFPDGKVCLVFADHRTCRVSEQIYGAMTHSYKPKIVFVGYSVCDYRDATFCYEGRNIRFSEEEYDSVVRSLHPYLKLRKGQVGVMMITPDRRTSKNIGSVKSTVVSRLEKIDALLCGEIAEDGISRPAFILGMVYISLILLALILLLFLILGVGDIAYVVLGMAKLLLIFSLVMAGIIIFVGKRRFGSRKWAYPDPDLAMMLSFIPGFGLIYLKKMRGFLIVAITAAYAAALVILFTGAFGIDTTDDIVTVGAVISAMSIFMIWTISVMETQRFCNLMYGDEWNSFMSRTIEGSQDMYICTVIYVTLVIIVPILCGISTFAIVYLAISVLYPIREHMLRKRLRTHT